MPLFRESSAAKVTRILKRLEECSVLVGVPAESGSNPDGASYASLGYLFEHGDPETNMPPRPWLGPSIDATKKEAATILKGIARKALREARESGQGGAYDPRPMAEKGLNRLGLKWQANARKRIREGIPPPLAPATVQARLHRRKNRRTGPQMTPLIDTGGFLKAVNYVIEVKGGSDG